MYICTYTFTLGIHKVVSSLKPKCMQLSNVLLAIGWCLTMHGCSIYACLTFRTAALNFPNSHKLIV